MENHKAFLFLWQEASEPVQFWSQTGNLRGGGGGTSGVHYCTLPRNIHIRTILPHNFLAVYSTIWRFGVGKIFFLLIILFSKDALILSIATWYFVTKDELWIFYSSKYRNGRKMYHGFPPKKLRSATAIVFITYKKMFLEYQISILEWFLKNRVTLKTGVMAAEHSAGHHRNKLHFKLHKNIKHTF